jgi:hypothetical protein
MPCGGAIVEINLGDVNYRPRGVSRRLRGLGGVRYHGAWSYATSPLF